MLMPIAASAYHTVSTPTADLRVVERMMSQFMFPPSADPLSAAEDALRPEEEHEDEHAQRADVLELRWHPQRRDLDEQADDDRSDERAEGGAESAERDAGEDEQQDLLAHRELQVLRQAEHDARQRGDGAAAGPDDADDPVHVDAGRGGQRRVVGDRPGGLAGTGAQQGDADHDEHADLDGHR